MKFPPGHRKDEDQPGLFSGVHPGDLGIVIVAFLITCGFVYILLTPQNWSAIDRAMAPDQPKPPPQQQKQGETPMILFDAKEK
ncbi:MAG: hypothetical protein BGN85_02035 [Alphaproteobacteria bacterium 64-11]|nr:hypothetical protein [Alphaproteobacteria bacterium]OJU12673.1 MAG: hypothetical protein BGN85_02035 [Alphaproteobacteria bacterium 64-11]